MQRIIKFRAWDGSKMLYSENGDFYLMPYGLCNVPSSTGHEFTSHAYPLMQFTGLQDKNGNDIYEGDIVKWDIEHNGAAHIVTKTLEYHKHKAAFRVEADYHELDLIKYMRYDTCEVIGNTYQTVSVTHI